jgi:large subunit ribosomal protein L21
MGRKRPVKRGPQDAKTKKRNDLMFAVIKTGGKQYKVHSGDILRVEKLVADAGETVQFNDILMLGGDSPMVGAPLIEGAGVQAEVVDQIKGEKVIHFVKRRRKHSSKRTKGHRQKLTLVKITDILSSGADKSGIKAAVGSVSGVAVEAAAPAKKVAAAKPSATAADDLTQLTGVGPAATKKLVEAGLTSFAQVAALSADDIAAIDAIKVKPEWVEQAAELAKG